jgi:hypothetical protein
MSGSIARFDIKQKKIGRAPLLCSKSEIGPFAAEVEWVLFLECRVFLLSDRARVVAGRHASISSPSDRSYANVDS